MSLSTWLRDYLYIPLGGNRKGSVRTFINLMITMLLGGLWHGAAIKFILWGALHGVGLMINKGLKGIIKTNNRIIRFFGWFFTFHFVVITWIVFRVDSLQNAQIIMDRIVHTTSLSDVKKIVLTTPYLFLLLIMGYCIHWLSDKFRTRIKLHFILAPIWIKIGIISIALYLVYSLHQSALLPFIYFRF